ncbi:serine recombinase [Terasakiella brassicae]|uniref:Serine recombinase n=1 Tax=Terasakiella brassicae TaxID=1634917 RepID=A0A917FEI3_9PROT|nr:recombinase family protein [Terasakiella brassicae]GGF71783.1 serine recombinase [Terasakiella brassicae]
MYNPVMVKKLHIYTRVSTVIQEEQGTSLETQKDMGIAKAKELGFDYEIWNEGGKSSKFEDLENRPILRKLMLAIEDEQVTDLFVFNTDRLSRNQRTWGSIRWKLKEKKVRLHTPSGVIDLASPLDELIIGILSEISQYDNALRSQRSQIGKLSKVKEGFWHGGPPPFGYRIENSKLVIDPVESVWVQRIFEMSAGGISTMNIKDELEVNQVETRRRSKNWSLGSIQKILHNTLYLGRYSYTDKKQDETVWCCCPAIVDQRLWDRVVQQRMTVLERKGQNNRTQKFYLLRNMMWCGHCGTIIGGKRNPQKREALYYCPAKERKWVKRPLEDDEKWVRGNGCGLERSLNIPRTDAIVFDAVHETLTHPEKLYNAMKDKLTDAGSIKNRRRLEKRKNGLLRDELERIEIAFCDVEADYRLGKIDQSIYDKLINKLTISRHSTQDDIAQSTRQLSEMDNSDQRLNELMKLTVVKTGDSDTDRQRWLERYTRRIDVRYDAQAKCHDLTIELMAPLVGDEKIGSATTKKSLTAHVGTTPR